MCLLSHKKGLKLLKKMGRRSKATISCINILRNSRKNLPAQVEDITNHQPEDLLDFEGNPPQHSAIDLLEEGFFMLDEDLGSDSEDETKDEECKDESIDKPVTYIIFFFFLGDGTFCCSWRLCNRLPKGAGS